MKYNGVIENKLRLLEKKLEEIDSWNIRKLEDFKSSSLIRNAVERALQVCVEIIIDIAERIIAIEGKAPSKSSAEAMQILENIDVVKNSEKYKEMVRFRNFIVHRYEYVDIEILFAIVTKKLNYFEKFITEVRENN
ncbi:MAG: DUF86 domain-containing protein [Candidatus Cloacimonadota bacterium]|nr:DUF86 domain-containing protein [Candidatus Cloacimonadota bacterium]